MEFHYVLRNKWFQLGSVATVAFAGGSIGGYILGKRQVHREVVKELKVVQLSLMDEETSTKPYIDDAENDPDMSELLEQEPMLRIVKTETTIERTVEPEEPAVVNVFANDDDWDWEAELSSRHQEIPYVVHQDEFIADEMGFRQETMTYYEGDDIMADPTDTPIYDYAGLMGELKFGHGTNDRNVVYIRNEKIHMEWEILRHQGMFSVEVAGLELDQQAEEELRHSMRAPLKFRQD